ncbi:MAG: ABC transporter permease [Fusicatenibacter sp.]|nr:ABC transporter permease [Fusicatenibacter sp.]
MNVNPVFEKEIKRNSRSIKISWIIFGCNLVLGVIAFACFFGESRIVGYLTPNSYSMPMKCYVIMAYAMFLLIILAVPSVAGGSIALEREKKTLDVLLTTNLNPWKIITGKLEASLGIIFVMAISTLPIISLIMVFGGIEYIDLLYLVINLLVVGIFVGSIGIFCSVVCKKTTLATVMSYLIVLLLVGGTIAAVAIVYYVDGLSLADAVYYHHTDIGAAIYILLLNPFLSFAGMICSQIGTGHEMAEICSLLGDYSNNPIVNHFPEAGMAVQLALSGILLFGAGYRINPLNR